MANLYRKYRPKNFSEVFSQNHIKITLQNEVISNSLSQAYLFCGPRAVGKTTLARIVAKSINCLKPEGAEPCSDCENCLAISKGQSLEVIEIDAASHTGVDNVRENIINSAKIPPSNLKHKVFIIDEVHMLSISAFNALLKLIEEPPKQTMFILCTTEVHKIPETVISRCERFDFKKISIADTVKKLKFILQGEGISSDEEVLEAIAKQADGYLRDAESLLGQVLSLKKNDRISLEEAKLVLPQSNLSQAMAFLKHLYLKETGPAIRLINDLAGSGADLKRFNKDLIILSRKICLNKIDSSLANKIGLDFGSNTEKELAQLENKVELEKSLNFLEEFLLLENKLKNTDLLQLPLEILAIRLSSESDYDNSKKPNFVSPSKGTKSIATNLSEPKAENNFETANNNNTLKSINESEVSLERPKIKPEETKEDLNTSVSLKIKDIQAKWKEFLIKIKKYNHSLTFILQNCFPTEIKGGEIKLLCKYKFHEERLKSATISDILEKACVEVFKEKLRVNPELDSSLEVSSFSLNSKSSSSQFSEPRKEIEKVSPPEKKESAQSNKNNLNSILSVFGGEIIN
ncbi:MAG: DNA polymerase III subunit gamma/tau [Candidatus Pacebacteria bacterium]|nr:DNA polymerase III subunit gamma/tau [Candidatus Paceibacterota bacterium]